MITRLFCMFWVISSISAIGPCEKFQSRQLYHGASQNVVALTPPFSLVVQNLQGEAVHFYNNDEVYTVTLKATTTEKLFKTFLIQPRTATNNKVVIDEKVGNFITDDVWVKEDLELESCFPLINDSVSRTEANSTLSAITLKWKSPTKAVGPVQFVVTVIVDPTLFWESWKPDSGFLLPTAVEKTEIGKSSKSGESLPIETSELEAIANISSTKKIESSDPCAKNECKHGAVCIVNGTGFSCECAKGFVGKFCQWECPAYLCQNGGTCKIDEDVNYVCLCVEGFIGNHCEEKFVNKTTALIDDKTKLTTVNLGSSIAPSASGVETTSLLSGSSGISKAPESSVTASTVSSIAKTSEITIISSSSKITPSTDINKISTGSSIGIGSSASTLISSVKSTVSIESNSSLSASSSGSLNNTSTQPSTVVTSTTLKPTTPDPTFISRPLVHDIVNKLFKDNGGISENGIANLKIPNACTKNECLNGATCIPGKRSYVCKCTGEFSGKFCQWGCPSYLCQNGGTCFIDEKRIYKCTCAEGFKGEKCDEKNVTTATASAIPSDFVNATDVWVAVKSLFIPSKSVQRLIDDRFNNTVEKFDANILQQIDDAPIDNRRRVRFLEAAEVKKSPAELLKILLAPDFCDNIYCYNNGTCVPNEQTKKGECRCVDGFIGATCGTKNFCHKHKCENFADCVNGFDDYTCKCRQDFSGKFCTVPCQSSTLCENGATCFYDEKESGSNKYKCLCLPGFTGDRCQKQIDECALGPCYNGATCIDKINGYECRCAVGYMGVKCDRPCQDSYKLCGKWKADGKCSGNTNATKFYEISCPAACGFCGFDNSTISHSTPASALLEQLFFLIGRWVVNTTDSKQFPFDLNDTKSGYYQELEIAPSEFFLFGNPALNYSSIVISNGNPDVKHVRAGLITMQTNGTVSNGTLFSNGNDGIMIKEDGELRYNRLELRSDFLEPSKDLEEQFPIVLTRTFSLAGLYLKEAIERKTNDSDVYFTKYYYKV